MSEIPPKEIIAEMEDLLYDEEVVLHKGVSRLNRYQMRLILAKLAVVARNG